MTALKVNLTSSFSSIEIGDARVVHFYFLLRYVSFRLRSRCIPFCRSAFLTRRSIFEGIDVYYSSPSLVVSIFPGLFPMILPTLSPFGVHYPPFYTLLRLCARKRFRPFYRTLLV